MGKRQPLNFSDLQTGDELLLRGSDLEAGAIVLRVHPFELVTHWHDTANHDAMEMRIMGSHADVDREDPFGARFIPSKLALGTFILMVTGTSDDIDFKELSYLKVTRQGEVVYEEGESN